MNIIEFSASTLRFTDTVPDAVPANGFVWIYLDRQTLADALPTLQAAALKLGGSTILDLHCQDLANPTHPSHYDFTSVYDRIIFRRLATQDEVTTELGESTPPTSHSLAAFARVRSRAVGFVVFDRLLISVHPEGCFTAKSFIDRYLVDAVRTEGMAKPGTPETPPAAPHPGAITTPRSRLPTNPSDLVLRMVNGMVDSYLDLRRTLGTELDAWQAELLRPRSRIGNWGALLTARNTLHMLQDLCEEQHDAMQEWLDTLREQAVEPAAQTERDGLLARARDVIDHIHRVLNHVRRLEQGAETAVQMHFSLQSNRTNDIMRTLTALTAIFLPLNLIAGIFGMNFEFIPLVHKSNGFWWAMGTMGVIALTLVLVFWRKRYLARTGQ